MADPEDNVFTFIVQFYVTNIAFCVLILFGFNILLIYPYPFYFLAVIFIFICAICRCESSPINITIYVVIMAIIGGGILAQIIYKSLLVQLVFALTAFMYGTMLLALKIYTLEIKKNNYYIYIIYNSLICFAIVDSYHIYGYLNRLETVPIYLILILILIHLTKYTHHLLTTYVTTYPDFVTGSKLYITLVPDTFNDLIQMKQIIQITIIDPRKIDKLSAIRSKSLK